MCLIPNSIKTAEQDLTFYKEVIIRDGKFLTPYRMFEIEIGKEYTLDTNIDELVKYTTSNPSKYNYTSAISKGVFHLYPNKLEKFSLLLKTTIKKGEKYIDGTFNDIPSVGVTRVCYEYINEQDKQFFQKLLALSKQENITISPPSYVDMSKKISYHTLIANKQRYSESFNFINAEGDLLSEQWYDYFYPFIEDFACVSLKDKGWNFINTKGELLSDVWFLDVYPFENGTAPVMCFEDKQRGYKYINTEGEFVGTGYNFNLQGPQYNLN